ncbi:MAG: DUF47 domain-containing protein, partial [Caldiserica bacterium]
MRFVLSNLFRKKSPFDGLKEHSEKVTLGIRKMKEAFLYYIDEDFENFSRVSEEVIKLENDADWIKGNIRNHLPKGIFMPVDRTTFLDCLKELDGILDIAEDIV